MATFTQEKMYLTRFFLIQSHFKIIIIIIIGLHTENKTVDTGSNCHLWSNERSFYIIFHFSFLLPAQLGSVLDAYIFKIIPASLGFRFSTHPEVDLIMSLITQAKGSSVFVVLSLLKPVQFNPGNCPLLAVDGIAYGY